MPSQYARAREEGPVSSCTTSSLREQIATSGPRDYTTSCFIWNAKWDKNRIKSLLPSRCHRSNARQPPFCCTPTNILTHVYRMCTTALLHNYLPSNAPLPPFQLLHEYLAFCCTTTSVQMYAYYYSAACLRPFYCTPTADLLHDD